MSKTTNTYCHTTKEAADYISKMIKNASRVGINIEIVEYEVPFDHAHTTAINVWQDHWQERAWDALHRIDRSVSESYFGDLHELYDEGR